MNRYEFVVFYPLIFLYVFGMGAFFIWVQEGEAVFSNIFVMFVKSFVLSAFLLPLITFTYGVLRTGFTNKPPSVKLLFYGSPLIFILIFLVSYFISEYDFELKFFDVFVLVIFCFNVLGFLLIIFRKLNYYFKK